MKVIREGDVLQSKTRTGAAKFWQGLILTEGKDYYLGSRHWQITTTGKTSKIQESVPYLVTPKNIGKANETTSAQQADSEFESIQLKQMDKGYLPKGVKADTRTPLPMTAKKFKEQKHKIVYPCYVQPKLNGMRMIFDGDKKSQSRGNKPFIPEVIQHLKNSAGLWLDGEIMLPGNVLLQTSMKAIKKYRSELSPKLLFHVYDIATTEEGATFKKRLENLKALFGAEVLPENIKFVPTYLALNEKDIEVYLDKFIEEGYEGLMVRNLDGLYQPGQKSNDLQKYKRFEDSEFKIIGMKEGEGQYKGCGIFRCVTDKGKEFDCVPEGSIEIKKEYYENRKKLMGKWLTIRYHGLSADGIPVPNPVGITVRDTEKEGH